MWALIRAGSALLLASMLIPSPVWAEKRVALIVGNAAYQHAAALANPPNDAQDIAAALSGLGFQVISGTDLDKRGLEQKVREFSRALEGADVGLFFYAGHGLQVKGVNYLVATDAKLEAERDLDFEAVKVDFVLSHMEREAKTNIVFLDACRNNPLARNLARSMGTRGVDEDKGLAPIKSGLGTFIAFATQPGSVASDGSARNSPFSAALKKHIVVPSVSISDLMIEVRKEVVGETKGEQVPWDHSALQGRFYFNTTIQASPPPTSTPAPPGIEASGEWSRVDKSSIVELETFLRRHGSSIEADYARSRLAALNKATKTAECSADGQWEQTATDVGTSTWTLTRSGESYHAQENGMGNAVGTAVMTGSRVRIDWRTGDFSGIYEWVIDPSCTTGEGQLVFYSGGTGTHRSVARRVAPPPTNPASAPAGQTKPASSAAAPVAAAGPGTRSTSKVHAQRKQLVTILDGTLRLRVTDSYAHGACTFEYDPGATGRFSETENLKTAEWITKKLSNGTYKITLVEADDESCTLEFYPE